MKQESWGIKNFKHNFYVKLYVYTENPEETQVIQGSMNIGYDIYIFDTVRTRTQYLFRHK